MSAVAEALAPFRGRGALTRGDARARRAARCRSWRSSCASPDGLLDLDEPQTLAAEGLRPVARGHARARDDPARRAAPLRDPSPGDRPAMVVDHRGVVDQRHDLRPRPPAPARCARSSCWAPTTRPCAAPRPSSGWRDRRRSHPRPPRPDAVRRGAHQLLPGRGRPAHAGRRRPELGHVAHRAGGGAGRARAARRGPRADRHHPPAHRPHRARADPGRPLGRRGVRARRAGAVAGALLGGDGGRRRLRRGDHAAPRDPARTSSSRCAPSRARSAPGARAATVTRRWPTARCCPSPAARGACTTARGTRRRTPSSTTRPPAS